jgi:hypothetical protein
LSQTILTYASQLKNQKRRPSNLNIHSSRDEYTPMTIRSAQMKLESPHSSIMVRKDAEGYFNGMVKKFLDRREQARSFEGVSRSVLDKSFSIKRKESCRK